MLNFNELVRSTKNMCAKVLDELGLSSDDYRIDVQDPSDFIKDEYELCYKGTNLSTDDVIGFISNSDCINTYASSLMYTCYYFSKEHNKRVIRCVIPTNNLLKLLYENERTNYIFKKIGEKDSEKYVTTDILLEYIYLCIKHEVGHLMDYNQRVGINLEGLDNFEKYENNNNKSYVEWGNYYVSKHNAFQKYLNEIDTDENRDKFDSLADKAEKETYMDIIKHYYEIPMEKNANTLGNVDVNRFIELTYFCEVRPQALL